MSASEAVANAPDLSSTTTSAPPIEPAPVSQPAAAEKPAGLSKDTPLGQLAAKLGEILADAGHDEVYGVKLTPWHEGTELATPQQVILQKFLRANANDVSKAVDQLGKTLKWRKDFRALDTKNETFDKSRFAGLGYVTELAGVPGSKRDKEVAVFNIYGAVKDNKKTFGDLGGFIRWRVALMELTLSRLDLANAKTPVPDYGKGPDPYQAVQVHDYLSVSFLRQPSEIKAASSKTIQLFQANYPETLSKKYFVNVPIVMQWMFAAMKMLSARETIAKMQWTSYGNQLHQDLGPNVPKAYGGTGEDLDKVGETPKYVDDTPTTTAVPDATKTEAPAAATPAEPSAAVEDESAAGTETKA